MSSNPTVPEDKWVHVNGLNIHYLDWGGDRTKKPLFMLHGIGGNAHAFDEFAPHFEETHHVVAVDERGCGDSDWTKEGYSAQSFAADVGAMAMKLGLYPFDYYGHSQGSRIGMAVGAYYGHLVDHLVLGDHGPLPDLSEEGRANARARLSRSSTPRPRGFFSAEHAFEWHREQDADATDEQLWRTIKHSFRRNWDGILVHKTDPEMYWLNGRTALKEGPFLWDCVGRISCKTLVLRGETTFVLDRPQAEKMAATIPNGNGVFKEVPDSGHGLHSENMDGTVEIVREFFST